MKLKECTTLINIEGVVYKLSEKNYRSFKNRQDKAFGNSNGQYRSTPPDGEDWSDLLHWVQERGKRVCNVESYNF